MGLLAPCKSAAHILRPNVPQLRNHQKSLDENGLVARAKKRSNREVASKCILNSLAFFILCQRSRAARLNAITAILTPDFLQAELLEIPPDLSPGPEMIIPVSQRIMRVEERPFSLILIAELRKTMIIAKHRR
jgi:hypothetical protein